MYQFIESIKALNGRVYHLDWHQKRVSETFAAFYPGTTPLNLFKLVSENAPSIVGNFKIKIVYNANDYSVEILSYNRKEIISVQLINTSLNYSFKFANRSEIDTLKKISPADEVIFIHNNRVMDSSFANLAFFDGNQWFTPTTFMLNGTTRQRLISENQIIEKEIFKSDILNYEKISFINALNALNENSLVIQEGIFL